MYVLKVDTNDKYTYRLNFLSSKFKTEECLLSRYGIMTEVLKK